MRYIIKCTRRNLSRDAADKTTYERFFGPFPDFEAARVDNLIESALNYCDGIHTIRVIQEVNRDENWAKGVNLPSLIRTVLADSRAEMVLEMARESKPFAVESPVDGRRFAAKIATIKELRTRYPGLGLKNAKDIVDEWERTGEIFFGFVE